MAHYIRNFGMESPLKLFSFKFPYQLENALFLGPENFAWGGVRIDSLKGTYKLTVELWSNWKILKTVKIKSSAAHPLPNELTTDRRTSY